MVGIPGFSKRLFDALSRAADNNVILITQSSSEHSICVAIEESVSQRRRNGPSTPNSNEITVGQDRTAKVESGFSSSRARRRQMKEAYRRSGRMFTTLGHNGINIHAIAQGSSERNISAIISSKDVRKAVNTSARRVLSPTATSRSIFISPASERLAAA